MLRAARQIAEAEMSDLSEFRLSIISMSDAELLEINRASLGHDWLTDVITFEIERAPGALEAELYLSAERAIENAERYEEPADLELLHLVIHGVLHLAGYEDKSRNGLKRMRQRERSYLVQFRPVSSIDRQLG